MAAVGISGLGKIFVRGKENKPHPRSEMTKDTKGGSAAERRRHLLGERWRAEVRFCIQ